VQRVGARAGRRRRTARCVDQLRLGRHALNSADNPVCQHMWRSAMWLARPLALRRPSCADRHEPTSSIKLRSSRSFPKDQREQHCRMKPTAAPKARIRASTTTQPVGTGQLAREQRADHDGWDELDPRRRHQAPCWHGNHVVARAGHGTAVWRFRGRRAATSTARSFWERVVGTAGEDGPPEAACAVVGLVALNHPQAQLLARSCSLAGP
jgi:hypothetical protein